MDRRSDDSRIQEIHEMTLKNALQVQQLAETVDHLATSVRPIVETYEDIAAVGRMGKLASEVGRVFLFLGAPIIGVYHWGGDLVKFIKS